MGIDSVVAVAYTFKTVAVVIVGDCSVGVRVLYIVKARVCGNCPCWKCRQILVHIVKTEGVECVGVGMSVAL